MHQDIKTFSDLSATSTHDKLLVRLVLKQHGNIIYNTSINNIAIVSTCTELFFDLLDTITLDFEITEFNEGTSGIEIESFTINGNEVLPKYKHLFSYDAYLDKIGKFTFAIPGPFYTWYHTISGQGWIA